MEGFRRVPRPCTAQLKVAGDLSFTDLIYFVWKQFGKTAIRSCASLGQGRWQLTFESVQALEKARERGLEIRNELISLEALEEPTTWLTVRNLPFELPKNVLVDFLSAYGQVVHHEFEVPQLTTPVTTGVRRIKMKMRRPVPNFLRVGIYNAMITYSGVTRLCRRCFAEGHMAVDCKTPFCVACKEWGHQVDHCPESRFAELLDDQQVSQEKRVDDETGGADLVAEQGPDAMEAQSSGRPAPEDGMARPQKKKKKNRQRESKSSENTTVDTSSIDSLDLFPSLSAAFKIPASNAASFGPSVTPLPTVITAMPSTCASVSPPESGGPTTERPVQVPFSEVLRRRPEDDPRTLDPSGYNASVFDQCSEKGGPHRSGSESSFRSASSPSRTRWPSLSPPRRHIPVLPVEHLVGLSRDTEAKDQRELRRLRSSSRVNEESGSLNRLVFN